MTSEPDVRQIALAAIQEMRRTGESYEMCARWIAERVNQARSSRPSSGERVTELEAQIRLRDAVIARLESQVAAINLLMTPTINRPSHKDVTDEG